MANIFSFEGFTPVVHESAFVHPNATVTGNVIIGRDVYIGPGAAIRGDWGEVVISDGCNVQENCIIHMFPGVQVLLEEAAHIGHGAIVHGARIGKNALVGMNAVIMDNAVIGEGSIIGALTFVAQDMVIPPRKVAVGNPAKVVKDVSDEMARARALVAASSLTANKYSAFYSSQHQSMKVCKAKQHLSPSEQLVLRTIFAITMISLLKSAILVRGPSNAKGY